MARVVLIYPRPNRITFDTAHTINLGLAYMAACLERRGHSVAVHDCNLEPDVLLPAKLQGAELVGIYVITAAYKASVALAERIKTNWQPDCKVILGGPHPTAHHRAGSEQTLPRPARGATRNQLDPQGDGRGDYLDGTWQV